MSLSFLESKIQQRCKEFSLNTMLIQEILVLHRQIQASPFFIRRRVTLDSYILSIMMHLEAEKLINPVYTKSAMKR